MTLYYIEGVDQLWSNPYNWFEDSGGSISYNNTPTNSDDVYIQSGYVDFVAVNSCLSLTIVTGATVIAYSHTGTSTNNGTIGIVNSSGILGTNNGTVTTNEGTITLNGVGGTITTNAVGAFITTNQGTVTTNAAGATVTTNSLEATITSNEGTVNYNYGTVVSNNFDSGDAGYGIVSDNYGTVSTNYTGGLVGYNTSTGIVGDNQGTITTNETGGIVTTNSTGTITTNNGTVNSNYGTIDTNYNLVSYNYRTITNNSATVSMNFSLLSIDGYIRPWATVGNVSPSDQRTLISTSKILGAGLL